jgi:hypothetical protein
MMSYVFTPNEYELCKDIKWDDVIAKIDYEWSRLDHRLVCDETSAPTIVLHNNFYPGTIQSAYDEVKSKKDINILHIYTSLGSNALTFGRHCDTVDVLLVQSIGKMTYIFDDESKVEMNPGDSLLIPKGVYHNPIVSQPRVTLSFSWE